MGNPDPKIESCDCGCLPFMDGSCSKIELFACKDGMLRPVIGHKNIAAVKAGIRRDYPELGTTPWTGPRPKGQEE